MIALLREKVLVVFAAALAAALSMALFGCASGAESVSASSESSAGSSPSASSAEDSSASAKSAGLSFGTKTGTSLSIAFKNETGRDITGLKAVSAVDQNSEIVLMGAGDSLPAGERAEVFLEPSGDGRFALAFSSGDAQYQLHDVDFTRLDEASIMVQDDIAYLTLVLDGNAISTLQEEYDAANPPVAEEPEVVYYDEPVETYYDEPADAPAQSEDACVDDVILN